MYIPTTIILLTTALSAGALAFPTATSTLKTLPTPATSVLKARTDGSWVAGFPDSACQGTPVRGVTAADGTPVDAQPKDDGHYDCLTFNTNGTYLGIGWGAAQGIDLYQGAHCEEKSKLISLLTQGHDSFCEEQDPLLNGPGQKGGVIGSFQFDPSPIQGNGV